MSQNRLTDLHRDLSRRSFLRGGGGALLGLGAAGALAACGDDDEPAGGNKSKAVRGTVVYFGWQGYDNPKAAKPLTQRGVKLQKSYITNNDETVTKLRSGSAGSIDVVTPYIAYVPAMVAAGLLEPLDLSRIPSAQDLFGEFASLELNQSEGKTYALAAVWADTPMTLRTDLFPEKPESWLDLRDPKYKGTLITLDDAQGNILIISRALFGPDDANKLTKGQLDDVVKVWRELKPNLVSISPSFGDILDVMARGDASGMIEGYRFIENELNKKGKPATSYLPKEGTFSWTDNYAIAKDAPNPAAAYAFIDTMLSPRGNAIVASSTGSGVTNQDAVRLLPKDQRDLYPYDNIGEAFEAKNSSFYTLPFEKEGDFTTFDEWQTAWEEIKSS